MIKTINKQINKDSSFNEILHLGIALVGGNLLATILRLIAGLLTARYIKPELLGVYNSITLILGYLPFFQLGVLNGLNRELPYNIGLGNGQKAKDLASTGLVWALILSSIFFFVFLCISLYYFLVMHDIFYGFGWLVNAFSAIIIFFGQYYLEVTFRTNNEFKTLSLIYVVQNSVDLFLVTLVKLIGYIGICLQTLVSGIVYLYVLYKKRPLRVQPRFSKVDFSHLLKIGAPIFWVGQLYSWWIILDSTLVVKMLGTDIFGYYQLAVMVFSTLSILPNSFSQVIYPRVTQEFGESNNLKTIIKSTIKPTILLVLASIVIACIGWPLLPIFVKLILPSYELGISAARLMFLVFILLCFHPLHIIFNVIRRQDLYSAILIISMLAYLSALFFLSRNGLSLIDFPLSMICGRCVYVLLMIITLLTLYKSHKDATI